MQGVEGVHGESEGRGALFGGKIEDISTCVLFVSATSSARYRASTLAGLSRAVKTVKTLLKFCIVHVKGAASVHWTHGIHCSHLKFMSPIGMTSIEQIVPSLLSLNIMCSLFQNCEQCGNKDASSRCTRSEVLIAQQHKYEVHVATVELVLLCKSSV